MAPKRASKGPPSPVQTTRTPNTHARPAWRPLSLVLGLIALVLSLVLALSPPHTPPTHLRGDGFSLALATVWRNVPLAWAEAWLQHHMALGFDRVYLYFDDPAHDRNVLNALQASPLYADYLVITASDAKFREQHWTVCVSGAACMQSGGEKALLPLLGAHVDTEHTARQLLYVARAAHSSREDGVDWLLHIDADELFHLPGLALDGLGMGGTNRVGNARDLFKGLSKQRYTHAAFFNDENLPEAVNFHSKAPATPFHQNTLMKKNPILMDAQQLNAKHT